MDIIISIGNGLSLSFRSIPKTRKLIEINGWVHVRTRGSHRQFKHKTKPGKVTISGKLNVDVPDLPGCVAVGETRDEALSLIKDTIEQYHYLIAILPMSKLAPHSVWPPRLVIPGTKPTRYG